MGGAVERLTPGYFALVMADGHHLRGDAPEGFEVISAILFVVCATAFVVLVLLTGWRLHAYRASVVDDFADPRRAFGFFTFVAGTNVLGVRLAAQGWTSGAAALLVRVRRPPGWCSGTSCPGPPCSAGRSGR